MWLREFGFQLAISIAVAIVMMIGAALLKKFQPTWFGWNWAEIVPYSLGVAALSMVLCVCFVFLKYLGDQSTIPSARVVEARLVSALDTAAVRYAKDGKPPEGVIFRYTYVFGGAEIVAFMNAKEPLFVKFSSRLEYAGAPPARLNAVTLTNEIADEMLRFDVQSQFRVNNQQRPDLQLLAEALTQGFGTRDFIEVSSELSRAFKAFQFRTERHYRGNTDAAQAAQPR
jgi:hypothetical protein